MSMPNVPDFDQLPFLPGTEQRCAWGIFDKDGKKDVYGTLNLLTPDVVKAAYGELKEGISVSLNWPLNAISKPGFNRKGLVHKVIDFRDGNPPMHGYDDELEFNTQGSSQWDSLCHFHHQALKAGYNGARTTKEELTQNYGHWDTEQKLPTLQHWHKRGGVVARAVLIDYKAYADETGKKCDPFSAQAITVDDIETIAKKQGVEFKLGDIIIVRSGYTEALEGLSGEEQQKWMDMGKAIGVAGDDETAKWFWNKHFAAVAGDAIAFEHLPPAKGAISDLVLHPYFLGQFGMSIGELWDLKELSKTCKKLGKYSFLLTTVPLNVPGLIGSPPNALALF